MHFVQANSEERAILWEMEHVYSVKLRNVMTYVRNYMRDQ